MRLLDTCIVIDYLRHNEAAISFIASLSSKPAISVVTITELFAGAKSQQEEVKIIQFYNSVNLLKLDLSIAQSAGNNLKHYQKSHNIDVPDAIIAATAEHHDLPLATLNLKHFPMFPRLKSAY